MLNLRIKHTKIESTPELEVYVEEKMSKIEKYLGDIQVIHFDIELEKTTEHHHKGDIYRAEVNLELPGELLRIERTEDDIMKAIDKVEDHLIEAIKKYKDKKSGN